MDLPAPTPVRFRRFGDINAQRMDVYDYAKRGVAELKPFENANYRIELADVDYEGEYNPTLAEEKDALLKGKSLHRPLKATVRLFDKTQNAYVDEQRATIAHVPHLNSRGMFVRNGVPWVLRNQARLRPGMYARRKGDGGVEAHFNVRPGTGAGFRIELEPKTGLFKLSAGQSTTRLYPLLRSLGIPDEQLKEAWGEELFNRNFRPLTDTDSNDLAKVVKKLGRKDLQIPTSELPAAMRDILSRAELDDEVSELTLGEKIKNLSPEVLVKASGKVLKLSRDEVEEDNRDSQAFQSLHSAEDYVYERLKRDQAGALRKLLWKAARTGKLGTIGSGALNPNIGGIFEGSGLAACYDADTLVLTARGFVAWPEVRDDDLFACRVDGRTAYKPATRILREQYCGEMLGYRNNALSMLVTPNHVCLTYASKANATLCRSTADSLFGQAITVPVLLGEVAQPISTQSDRVSFSCVEGRHGHVRTLSFVSDDWADFLGWWMSEGSAFRDGPCYTVTIAQSMSANPKKWESINALLTRMGLRYRYNVGAKQFIIRNKTLFCELTGYGNRDRRKLPRWIFEQPDARISRFLTAYWLGDGHVTDEGWAKCCTVSRELALGLCEAIARVGFVARYFVQHRKTCKYPLYVIHMCATGKNGAQLNTHGKQQWFSKPYCGTVYCATVPGGQLYVMRDGKPQWNGNCPEDINPSEIYDLHQAITRMGEGGIASEESVSLSARGIQPSYIGVIDPVRGPESSRLGLDLRATDYALKGSDNKLYGQFLDARTGEPAVVAARDAANKIVAFPGALQSETKRVLAIANGKIDYVDRDKVDYVLPSANRMMSRAAALIPFPQGMKAQRLLMGSRMTAQSMPLLDGESPLVSAADEDGSDLGEKMGEFAGARRSDVDGVVQSVTPDGIVIKSSDGTTRTVELYNNYPTARKTFLNNTPLVKPGDPVKPGQVIARSNFTDSTGKFAVGRNLRVAFMAAKGFTHEDAWVISESAAKKLRHESMYKHDLDLGSVKSTKKADYRAIYADKYTKEQYDNLDDDGVVKEGTYLKPGDPIILAFAEKPKRGVGAIMDSPRATMSDRSQVWEHEAPGTVASVTKTSKGINVAIRSGDMSRLSDKLSGRYGNKGVISKIVPDEQMPILADGKPAEVLANTYGIISRQNPAALAEALLGKVAAKTGKPYVLKPFDTPQGMAEFALQEAIKHGVVTTDEAGNPVDTETVTDPETGRKIPGVFTGTAYFMKLHHMAESKLSARDTGGYTLDDAPAKGGFTGAKRIGNLDYAALLAAGATEFLRDAKLVRGQRNDDYWRKLKLGETPFTPNVSFANQAFKAQLKAAGVNIREQGTKESLAPMLDRDVDALAGASEIDNSKTFDFESMRPEKGGLFDIEKTGGASGSKWSKITLPVKIPHPLFQEPIVRILDLTNKRFESILAGKEQLNGKTGPEAIEAALAAVDLDREVEQAKIAIRGSSQGARDSAVRKLNYLHGLKTMELQPTDLLISKIPVLPPKYRPVIPGTKTDMIHDMNYLYHDLLEARQNYNDASTEFGEAGEEYLTLYNAAKAVTGVSSPVNPKTAEQGVGGILQDAIGLGDSPKFGRYIRKVLGTSVDTVGRGVITSDPDLGLDEVGVPEEMAWNIFKPFIIKRLVQNGTPASEAVMAVRNRTKQAELALQKEMKERPVVYNRAPALHKFNYVAAFGKLRKDNAIGLPYYTLQGIAGDYDGDTINLHVPVGDKAVKEVQEKLLPSKNLLHPANYEPHLEPRQDFLAGLYVATQPDDRQPVQVFPSEEAAKAAYRRGEISARTPIRIIKA